MRYLDNRLRDSDSFMGHWLQNHINPDILGIELQFGYFNFKALEPFAANLRTAGENGALMHFVLGANQRQLTDSDLRQTFELIEPFPDSSLTVVAFADGLFHPKVAFVETEKNEFACLVGSGNFTSGGLSKNIEAFLAIDTAEDDCLNIIEQIRDATTYWRSEPSPDGAFPVRESKDIRDLLKSKIISTDDERKEKEESQRSEKVTGLASLRNDWKPANHEQESVDWIAIAKQERDDLSEEGEYVDVELFDGRYRLALLWDINHKNEAPIAFDLKSKQVVDPLRPLLRKIIDEKNLRTVKERRTSGGNELGNRTRTRAIIDALRD